MIEKFEREYQRDIEEVNQQEKKKEYLRGKNCQGDLQQESYLDG